VSDEGAIDEVCDDLRRAVKETSRPQRERRIVRARNALERAISILEHAGQPAGDPTEDAEDGGGD
jgi:RNA polymerase-interacting CarD/CdnL/TRCF family regulator